MSQAIYRQCYQKSHALIVGVDKYQLASPLSYAANDATAVASTLREKLGFPSANITLLLDAAATRSAIMSAFMAYSNASLVGPDDRILVFFAGHGHTAGGRRGETGFLVPVDGNPDDLATLIRWDELTRNADLILAKHIFFLMDACYGGLALTRKPVPAGSMRFLEDMMQRFSRQVLTAGKPDELVSDGGGIRPGHSIFTSHVLDALEGVSSATEGVITANGVMAHVYSRVAHDPLSQQTPHYGFLDGDGDFIFAPLLTGEASESAEPLLVKTPSLPIEPEPPVEESASKIVKRLVGNPSDRIHLDDFLSQTLRRAVRLLNSEEFSNQGPFSQDEFSNRLRLYEGAISEIVHAAIVLARWSTKDQLPLISGIFSRLSESARSEGGLVIWLRLRWYPVLYSLYAGGIAALAQGRYDALAACLLSPGPKAGSSGGGSQPVIESTVLEMTEIVDVFKRIPGYERRYTSRSDYIYQSLQPILEDQIFLGNSYEKLFNRFEIFLALVYADVHGVSRVTGRLWGPPGRFAWLHARGDESSPYTQLVTEAAAAGSSWGPFQAGLFGGSPERFASLASSYEELLANIGWH